MAHLATFIRVGDRPLLERIHGLEGLGKGCLKVTEMLGCHRHATDIEPQA